MAVGLRGFFRLNIGLGKTVFSKSNFVNVGVRFMYTDQDLGILSYEHTRFTFRNQFVSIEDTFRTKMKEICQKADGVVFTEDLKAMVHLAQANEEDMELITNMLKKFVKAKSERQFGSYAFGPVVMRMFYYLNEPNRAVSLFTNSELTDSFVYHSALRILLCLLLKHQMYPDMRNVFEIVKNMKGNEFVTSSSILIYAACFKENTSESAEYAMKCWTEHCKIRIPSVRATAIVSSLAIKHNLAEEALEMLSVVNRENSIAVRCLKLLAYTHLNRYLQIIPLLKHSIEQDTSIPHRHGYFADVIYELEEKLNKEDVSERNDILNLINKLRQQQRIETERTLEEFLMRPLQLMRKPLLNQNLNQNFMNRSKTEVRSGLKNYL